MAEPTYALSWPRELFELEAKRIRDSSDEFPLNEIVLLLEEAFEDDGVSELCEQKGPSFIHGPWPEPIPNPNSAEKWFDALLKDETRLRQYEAPKYWAQRTNSQHVRAAGPTLSLAAQFIELVVDLSGNGYLPRVLPAWCTDEMGPTDEVISARIGDAIGMHFSWGAIKAVPHHSTDDLIYSLVEYFHDYAQRPRSSWEHGFDGQDWHHSGHDTAAGQAVYRWKVNQLLTAHNRPLRLADDGEERGRLVREFSPSFQGLVESQLAAREQPGDEIAHAIRDFRSRDASLVAKRAAITLIANNLEARRQTLKVQLEQDENDLFNIANNYQLRHRNAGQKDDYGHEFADWIFWNFLAAVELLDALERRGSQG